MLCLYYYEVRFGAGYTPQLYRVAWWMLLMEISSIFYNLRLLVRSKALDGLFAASFLLVSYLSCGRPHVIWARRKQTFSENKANFGAFL